MGYADAVLCGCVLWGEGGWGRSGWSGIGGIQPKRPPSRNCQRAETTMTGIGFSFQPAIVASRLDLINCDIAPSAKIPLHGYPDKYWGTNGARPCSPVMGANGCRVLCPYEAVASNPDNRREHSRDLHQQLLYATKAAVVAFKIWLWLSCHRYASSARLRTQVCGYVLSELAVVYKLCWFCLGTL